MQEAALGLLPFAAPVHPCTMRALLATDRRNVGSKATSYSYLNASKAITYM